MSHTQNKSHPYPPVPTRGRECAITRSRYKMMEKMAEPEVYYSDEDDSHVPKVKNQFDYILKKAQGQVQRPHIKDQLYRPSAARSRKARPNQNKKKVSKGKVQSSQSPINSPEQQPLPTAVISPIQEEPQQQVDSLCKPEVVQTPKSYLNHEISFQTNQQSQLNKIEGIKNRIDRKFAAAHNIKRPVLSQKIEIPFNFVPEYRAFFQKQTKCSYEEYQLNHDMARENAVASKISQLIKLQQDSAHRLLRRIEQQKFRFKKNTSKVIQSIAEASTHVQPTQPVDKHIVNAACASNLHQDFPIINKFLASNHSLINEHPAQLNKNSNNNQTHANNNNSDVQMKSFRQKKRKERQALDVYSERMELSQQNEEQLPVRPIQRFDIDTDPKNRKKMLATIELFNQQCTEQEKYQRIQSEKMERQRQDRQRAKQAKKQQHSNASAPFQHIKNESMDESDMARRMDTFKQSNWMQYQKTNPKIKRLEILNRYHYNPFQENEGEDQCQLWKKLMSQEIKSIKNQHMTKHQDHGNNVLVQELLRAVDAHEKNADVFHLTTTYKPLQQNLIREEEEFLANQERERKSKSIKKKKKNKKQKDSREDPQKQMKDPSNNEPQIDDFLDLGPKEEYVPPYQTKIQYMGGQSQTERQAEPEYNMQASESQNNNDDEPLFQAEDQLPHLQGFQDVKLDENLDDDEPLFQSEAPRYRDIDYYEQLVSKQQH